jgi:Protein of unknown function (DUF1456)
MTNNEVLKKIRVALALKDTDIIDILKLADFDISKGALGDLFRSEDHPNFVEAGDQILRNFLNGLIIYKRGPEMKRESSTPKKASLEPKVYNKSSPSNVKNKSHDAGKKIGTLQSKSGGFSTNKDNSKGLFDKDYFTKKR